MVKVPSLAEILWVKALILINITLPTIDDIGNVKQKVTN